MHSSDIYLFDPRPRTATEGLDRKSIQTQNGVYVLHADIVSHYQLGMQHFLSSTLSIPARSFGNSLHCHLYLFHYS